MAPQFFRDTFVILCGVVEVGENAVRNVCSLMRGRKPKYGSADPLDPARGKTVLITGMDCYNVKGSEAHCGELAAYTPCQFCAGHDYIDDAVSSHLPAQFQRLHSGMSV